MLKIKFKLNILGIVILSSAGLNQVSAQNIGINSTGANPDGSAMLDIVATDKGILVPRMTTAQRTGIGSPAKGLMVFDNTTSSFWYFDGLIWVDAANDGNGIYDGDGTTPAGTDVTVTDFINFDANTFYVDGTNNRIGIGTNTPGYPLHNHNGFRAEFVQAKTAGNGSYTEYGNSTGALRGLIGSDGIGYTGTSNQFTIATWTAHPIKFFTNQGERMVIDAVGNVGISTLTPLQRLHVEDDIIIGAGQAGGRTPDGNTEHLKIWAESKVWNVGVINDASAANSDFFVSQTDGANDGSFTIDPNGNVGINQLAATHRLDVLNTTATTDRGAVYGRVTNGTNAYGILGYNTDDLGLGVVRVGVYGNSGTGEVAIGGRYSGTKFGYIGSTTYGLYAEHSVWAGHFQGNVHVNGTLSKSAGTFKIDHPLDPENKYLIHSFVESPDMMNVYNGNITTDGNGRAIVTLPAYFEASNKDFRYQLTVIGVFADVIIKEKIKNNQFIIETSQSNVEVSWQVTGIRNDAYAQKHRIISEVDKAEEDKGKYLNPEVLGHPKSEGIHYHEINDFEEDGK
jgi:hypothetical protein